MQTHLYYLYCLLQEDVTFWAAVSELREAVNGTLEKARIGKAIGASLEARVILHVSDPGLRARLAQLDKKHNGADDLRYIFIVSQVMRYNSAVSGSIMPALTEA